MMGSMGSLDKAGDKSAMNKQGHGEHVRGHSADFNPRRSTAGNQAKTNPDSKKRRGV
jgi:hypothetical protein